MREADDRPVVLAVDDVPEILELVQRALGPDYRVVCAADAGAALDAAGGQPRPNLILLDVDMPGATGFDVCRVLKSDPQSADIPVLFLSAVEDPASQIEGLELGAAGYILKPVSAAVLRTLVGHHIAIANRQRELERLVRERTAQLERTRLELIRRLARAMEYHESSAVGNRVMRLAQYAKLLALAAGAKPELAEMVMAAAPLHDIGKLAVPAEVLRKSGKLSAPDWERVRRHPELGAEIIGEHDDTLLRLARQMALHHHEHWDGSGYPAGLKGNDIPWAGRLMAIVDTFESMTTTQFYREPRNVLEAATEVTESAGRRFDPKLVEAFTRAFPEMRKVRENFADELGDMINLDFSPARDAAKKVQKAALSPSGLPK